MMRMLEPRWWLPEIRRVLLVSPLGVLVVLAALPVIDVRDAALGELVPDVIVVWMIAYFALYSLITILAFSRSTRRQLDAWARTEQRGTFVQRYVLGTAPGPGMSIAVGVAALVVTVLWLPGGLGSTLDAQGRTGLAVVLVVMAWITVAVSFTVAYLVEDMQSGGEALKFPSADGPVQERLGDYAYVAIAVSSTFGTTDVDLQTTEVRRTATIHAVVAFVFNTVVLAVVVSLLA